MSPEPKALCGTTQNTTLPFPFLEIVLPFARLGKEPCEDREIVVVDCEVDMEKLCVIGYYDFSTGIHEFIFPTPIATQEFQQTSLFQQLFGNDVKIAAYNIEYEHRMLGVPKDRCIELMPYPYCPKEKFIIVESLDKVSGRKNAKWSPASYADIIIHNYSCMVKEILLYLGLRNFARFDIRNQLKDKLKEKLKTCPKQSN